MPWAPMLFQLQDAHSESSGRLGRPNKCLQRFGYQSQLDSNSHLVLCCGTRNSTRSATEFAKLWCVRSFCSYLSLPLLRGDFSLQVDKPPWLPDWRHTGRVMVRPCGALGKVNGTGQELAITGRAATFQPLCLFCKGGRFPAVILTSACTRAKLNTAHKMLTLLLLSQSKYTLTYS